MPEQLNLDFISDDPDELLIRQGIAEGFSAIEQETGFPMGPHIKYHLEESYCKQVLTEIGNIDTQAEKIAEYARLDASTTLDILGENVVLATMGRTGLKVFNSLIDKQTN